MKPLRSRMLALALLPVLVAPAAAEGPGREEKPPVRAVEIRTADGLTLAADLHEPAGGGETKPAVLALHNEGGDRTVWNRLGDLLSDNGVTVLAVDLRGHGGSRKQGEEDLGARAEAGDAELWKSMDEDVKAGLSWLRGTLLADGKNIGIVGLSAGAALALQRAGKDDGVRAVLGVAPSPLAFGIPGIASLARWDDRPIGWIVGEKNTGDASALERALKKFNRVEPTVIPVGEKIEGAPFLATDGVVPATAQFFVGWFFRPVLTGKPEEGVRRGNGIFGSGSSNGAGCSAGGMKVTGYLAPGKIQGIVVLADPDPSANRLTERSRRLTLVPGKGKVPTLSAMIERWSGSAWKKDKPVTVVDCGAIVTEGETTFYEVWISPSMMEMQPFTEIAFASAPLVGGKASFQGGFDRELKEDRPSTWSKWELR